ncbi:hypothetical protein AB0L75_41540 [Streptomyces sp. NPDC052101]|uniref:hypothetical protein n=1 Tax=Streptomyces sp. NPDC052101 TaxID=3155763 RepID=UPI00343B5781
MRKLKRCAAATAAALALATTGVVSSAGTANAATTCGGWTDIGSPGNLRAYGAYAGQVEQQFQPFCGGGGQVQAHFQWDENFRNTYSGTKIYVSMEDSTGQTYATLGADTGTKNVYTIWPTDIHTANPDIWGAYASLQNRVYQICWAAGTMHNYANGSTWFGASGNC